MPSQRYSANDYVLYTDSEEPECFVEAMQNEAKVKWELAMKEEMNSLKQNKTWDLVKLPVGKKALFNKWVYKMKNEVDGTERCKARLVVKGYAQKEGIDFQEIFFPIVESHP